MDVWIWIYQRSYGIIQNGRKLTTDQPDKLKKKSIKNITKLFKRENKRTLKTITIIKG